MDAGFLLTGGLALLLVLVGWSDQIAGTQERTRRQEMAFLKVHRRRWEDVRSLVRAPEPSAASERLIAALKLMASGGLSTQADVKILKGLEALNTLRSTLRRVYFGKFSLVLATSLFMLAAGVFLPVCHRFLSPALGVTWGDLVWMLCFLLLGSLLALTVASNLMEGKFRDTLAAVDDLLRAAPGATTVGDGEWAGDDPGI